MHGYIKTNPVIGIVTIPSDSPEFRNPKDWSYFESNYALYLESAGAQVVPIPYDLPKSEIRNLISKINGVLFTGGDTLLWKTERLTKTRSYSRFTNRARFIYQLALEANARGDFFPVWGTCQGLELITILTTKNPYILDSYNQQDIPGTIVPLPSMYKSDFFSEFSGELLHDMKVHEDVWFWHQWGLNVLTYDNVKILEQNFELLALGNDTRNKTFVAAMEGKRFPIYATQFHPERIAFDWFDTPTVPHHDKAIEIAQHLSNFYVNQARKNSHKFDDELDLRRHLVNQYPTYIVPDTLIPTYYFYKHRDKNKRRRC